MKKLKGPLGLGIGCMLVGVALLVVAMVLRVSPIDFSSITVDELRTGEYYQFDDGIILDVVATENGVYSDDTTASQAYYCSYLVTAADEAGYIITLKIPANSRLADSVLSYMTNDEMKWGDLTVDACGQVSPIDNDYYTHLEDYISGLEEAEVASDSILSRQVEYIGQTASRRTMLFTVEVIAAALLMCAGVAIIVLTVVSRRKKAKAEQEPDFSYYAGPEQGFQADNWEHFSGDKDKKGKKKK